MNNLKVWVTIEELEELIDKYLMLIEEVEE